MRRQTTPSELDNSLERQTERHVSTLKEWVENSKEGDIERKAWYLITGPPGTGKTTLIERLLYQLGVTQESQPEAPKIIYHFCQIENGSTSDPLDFIRYSMVPQLIDHYGQAYKKFIPPGKYPLLVGDEKEAMRAFVIEPLRKLKAEYQEAFPPLIVIIDDLTVLDPTYTILDLLLDNRGDLEDIARFIVTADEDERDYKGGDVGQKTRNIIEDIYWLTNNHRRHQPDLPLRTFDNVRILFKEMQRRLAPLFEVEYYRGSPEEYQALLEIKEWRKLYYLFDEALERTEQKYETLDWWAEKVTRLLNVVAIAHEALYIDTMAAIIEADADQTEQLKLEMQPFFKDYENYEKFSLYHGSLKAYRLHKMSWWNKNKRDKLADMHKLFVEAFRPPAGEWAAVADWATLSGTQWPAVTKDKPDDHLDSIARYARRYLVNHAYYSCYYTSWNKLAIRRDRAKDFLALICDPGFRTARLREVGHRAALQDIWQGLRIINAEYIHTEEKYHKTTRVAFDRLLAAQQPHAYRRNKLIELEEKLRSDSNAGWQDLFAFLGFEQDYELTWW